MKIVSMFVAVMILATQAADLPPIQQLPRQVEYQLEGEYTITAVLANPLGLFVAYIVSSTSGAVSRFNKTTGQLDFTIDTGPAQQVVLSAYTLATCYNGQSHIWSAADGEMPPYTFTTNSAPAAQECYMVQVEERGVLIGNEIVEVVYGSQHDHVRRTSVKAKPFYVYGDHGFSSNSYDGGKRTISQYNLFTGELIKTFDSHFASGKMDALPRSVSDDGLYLFGQFGRWLLRWELATGALMNTLELVIFNSLIYSSYVNEPTQLFKLFGEQVYIGPALGYLSFSEEPIAQSNRSVFQVYNLASGEMVTQFATPDMSAPIKGAWGGVAWSDNARYCDTGAGTLQKYTFPGLQETFTYLPSKKIPYWTTATVVLFIGGLTLMSLVAAVMIWFGCKRWRAHREVSRLKKQGSGFFELDTDPIVRQDSSTMNTAAAVKSEAV